MPKTQDVERLCGYAEVKQYLIKQAQEYAYAKASGRTAVAEDALYRAASALDLIPLGETGQTLSRQQLIDLQSAYQRYGLVIDCANFHG